MVKVGDTVEWELKRFGIQRGVVVSGAREGSDRWRIKKDDGSLKFVFKDKITRVVPEKKKTVEKTVEEPSSVTKKKKTVVRNKKPKPALGSGKWIGSYKGNWGEVVKEPEPQGGLVETSFYTSEFMGNDPQRIKRLLEIDRKYKEEDKKKGIKQNVENVKDIQSKMMAGDLDLEAKEWYDPQTGAEYMKVWDPEDNRWLITNPETNGGIGYLDKQGKLIKI